MVLSGARFFIRGHKYILSDLPPQDLPLGLQEYITNRMEITPDIGHSWMARRHCTEGITIPEMGEEACLSRTTHKMCKINFDGTGSRPTLPAQVGGN